MKESLVLGSAPEGTRLLHCNSVASTLARSVPEGICRFAGVFFTVHNSCGSEVVVGPRASESVKKSLVLGSAPEGTRLLHWFAGVFFTVLAAIPGLLAETKLGKPLTLPKPVTVAELMAKPVDSVGRTVQVTGRITEVCEKMGCWLNLVEPQSTKQVRFKVNDGEIVIPTQSVGKMAIAEGKLVKFDLTREQTIARARHEAEEQGRKFDANKIKAGSTVYQIQGDGVVIID